MTTKQILIVEDDPDSRLLLRIIVRKAIPDANMVQLESVAEARKLGDEFQGQFDLALLDGMLLDGTITDAWPFLEPFCERAAIALVSALNYSELKLVADTLPVTKIIQKPVSPTEILAFITESLEGSL